MATQVRESGGKPATKHDTFIETQLARTEQRIRLIDLTTAACGFVAGTLAFALFMMLLDRQFVLAAASRQFALVLYLLVAGAYLVYAVVRPLRWRVNPHYAARQLEQTLATNKNHVINWIDLREEKLPGVIRSALGQRAARDLSNTDADQAISSRRAITVGAVTGFLAVTFVVLLIVFGPRPFSSLLARTFSPFSRSAGIATRTQIAIQRPEGGDAVVTIGNPVTIVAEVGGRVPDPNDRDAPCLLYRHDESEPYRKRYLQRDEFGREWSTTVAAGDVSNGFLYKVTAGDAETAEHRVSVRPAPLISNFLATYRYRAYVGKADRSRESRKLEDLRGTKVEILARTTRTVKEGRLDFEPTEGVSETIRAEVRADDPAALRFSMVLDKPGKYRIRFVSIEGEAYIDTAPFDVVVIQDQPPQVELTRPGKNVELPLNGHLELEGVATDDIGVAALNLRMQVVKGSQLKAKPYLADKLGKPEFGTPQRLEYRDVLDLPALVDERGSPAELKSGMEIEYWLEARDGCDFPRPQTSTSRPIAFG